MKLRIPGRWNAVAIFFACVGLAPWNLEVNAEDTPETKAPAKTRADAPRLDRYGDPLPEGAIARIGTTRFRGIWLSPGSLTPDEQTLVCCGRDGEIHFVDAVNGKEHRKAKLTATAPTDVAVSPDGARIAVSSAPGRPGGDSKVAVFDYRTCRELFAFDVHVAPVDEKAGAPASARSPRGIPARPGDVFHPEFSRDGKRLVGICGLRKYRVYQADAPGALLYEMDLPLAHAYAHEAEWLAWVEWDDCHLLRLWDVPRWRKVRDWKLSVVADDVEAHSVALSDDGKTAAVGWKPWLLGVPAGEKAEPQDYAINIIEADTGRQRRILPGERLQPERLVLSHGGGWLVASQAESSFSNPKRSRLWNTLTGEELWLSPKPIRAPAFFSKSGSFLYETWMKDDPTAYINVWDIRAAAPTIDAPTGRITHAELSPDSSVLATSYDYETVRLWTLAGPNVGLKAQQTVEDKRPWGNTLAFVDGGRGFAVSSENEVEFWSIDGKEREGNVAIDGCSLVQAVVANADGTLLAMACTKRDRRDHDFICVYDYKRKELSHKIILPKRNFGELVSASDGDIIAVSFSSKWESGKPEPNGALVLDARTGRTLLDATMGRGARPLALSRDGQWFAAPFMPLDIDRFTAMQIWDVSQKRLCQEIPLASGYPVGARLDGAGEMLVLTVWLSRDSGISEACWNCRSGQKITETRLVEGADRVTAVSRDGKVLAIRETNAPSLLIYGAARNLGNVK